MAAWGTFRKMFTNIGNTATACVSVMSYLCEKITDNLKNKD